MFKLQPSEWRRSISILSEPPNTHRMKFHVKGIESTFALPFCFCCLYFSVFVCYGFPLTVLYNVKDAVSKLIMGVLPFKVTTSNSSLAITVSTYRALHN